MHRLLLSCKSIDDSRLLKNYLETELPFEIFLANHTSEIAPSLKAKNIHLLILQTGLLAKQDMAYALQLRSSGYNYPIMMITDVVGDMDVEEANDKHKIYFMERPFELRTMKGLVRKLLSARPVVQQVFRRYRTNIPATIETFISGDKFPTHMFNLSRGGAYFELPKKPNVNVGDLLRLKVQSGDAKREHSVHGRIVWMTHKGHAAGGYGVGVKFMKSTDIYRNLLDRV
jgi:Tfp pilus assembly protein PilZ